MENQGWACITPIFLFFISAFNIVLNFGIAVTYPTLMSLGIVLSVPVNAGKLLWLPVSVCKHTHTNTHVHTHTHLSSCLLVQCIDLTSCMERNHLGKILTFATHAVFFQSGLIFHI